ncbi:MAG: HNH endonuclease [Chloroflexi bacterium]|nr:HNH endonuclease [Chloroflexota bacterium]
MATRLGWTRQELLVAFSLYCRLPFGRLHHRNPEIIRFSEAIGRSPSALAMKLTNIASLDPAITSTGRAGLRSASANDRAMWDEMQGDWERFAIESEQALSEAQVRARLDKETSQDDISDRVGEDRITQTSTRIGQNFFRSTVLSAYNGRCCITGLSLPALLVASHIVPWRHDSANRVNPRNSLLLSALHDKAFDSGFITIRDDMTVQVSRKQNVINDQFFSESIVYYDGKSISLPEKFSPGREFLSYHREHIFEN